MAHKMKGFPMMDTSSKHGTNKNYDKSGAPNLLGKILDPLGLKKKLMGGNKPCPPAAGQPAPVVGAAQPVEPVTPTAAPAVPVVDPNAGVSAQGEPPVQMKENLKVGAPMKAASPMKHGDGSGEAPLSDVQQKRLAIKKSYSDKHGSSSGGSDDEWNAYQASLKALD